MLVPSGKEEERRKILFGPSFQKSEGAKSRKFGRSVEEGAEKL